MPDLHDHDDKTTAFDRIDDAVVAHAKPIEVILPLKLPRARRSRILSKRINPIGDTALNLLRQGCKLSLG
jgi:hypothetical protein